LLNYLKMEIRRRCHQCTCYRSSGVVEYCNSLLLNACRLLGGAQNNTRPMTRPSRRGYIMPVLEGCTATTSESHYCLGVGSDVRTNVSIAWPRLTWRNFLNNEIVMNSFARKTCQKYITKKCVSDSAFGSAAL